MKLVREVIAMLPLLGVSPRPPPLRRNRRITTASTPAAQFRRLPEARRSQRDNLRRRHVHFTAEVTHPAGPMLP